MATAGNQPEGINAASGANARWERLKLIFEAALACTPAERSAYVASQCGDDAELRSEVESLLESHDQAGDFIEEPPPGVKPLLAEETPTVFLEAGARIGAYRLVRELGRGGMGAVYLAVRADEEFQKRVAIKLIRPGMESDFVVRRFRNERQILARLEHANIARLIDGGTTSEGLPYFIMEYVEGIPVTEYCESNRLTATQRLELFLKVCAAVQYAHERHIIHRDLKPNNVLIKKDGNPKLLDFGIAKMFGSETARSLETTLMGVRLMTPAYASPEQLRGEPATHLSDIYSLGILLGEVLTGRRPNDTPTTEGITEGGARDIVNRAIQSSPANRYQSVAELANDIRNYLAGEAVNAQHMTIAVLPFRVSSSDHSTDEYLGLALADSLITKLSNVRRVSVRSTRSVLKAGDMDPIGAGVELGVDCVVDGSIRASGDRVRMTVQLISVRERCSVWAAQFDEHLDDLLKLEDRLSSQVAHALLPRLSGEERRELSRRHTVNAKAHQAYLKGRWYWSANTEESLAKALVLFSEAVSADPSYAPPHAGIADYYLWLGMRGGMPAHESFAAAKEHAAKAVELDDSLAEAHASLGAALWANDRDFAGAEKELKRAIHLNVNLGRAHQWLGLLHSSLGRHEQAMASLERARETDPECPQFAATHAWCLYNAREYRQALELLDALLLTEGPSFQADERRAWCLLQLQEKSRAIELARSAAELSGRGTSCLAALACALADSGDAIGARAIVDELKKKAKSSYVSCYHLALPELALGDRKASINHLEEARTKGDWWVLWADVEPRLDALRRENALRKTPTTTTTIERPRRSKKLVWAGAAAAVVVIAAGIAAVSLIPKPAPFQRFSLSKLTTNGIATHAAISVDGRYVAYSAKERGLESLWLRQTNLANPVRIMPPMESALTRLAFAPDGNSLSFFAVRPTDTGHSTLYQVPSLGGDLRTIATGLSGPASVSPEGDRIAGIRANPSARRDELFIRKTDGSGERLLATRQYPDRFSYPSTPVWSHDGKRILCAVEGSDDHGYYVSLQAFDVDTGKIHPLTARRWQFIEQASWLGDDSGVMLIGQEKDSSFQHIWYMPYPSGPARQINNDLADYTGLTVTGDSTRLVTVQIQTLTNVYVAKPSDPGTGVQVTAGAGRYFDLKWAPQDRIVYASDASGFAEIWLMNADGSGQRQLTNGHGRSYSPAASPDGKFIVFHSNRSGNWNIWRLNPEVGSMQQLTFGTQDSNWPEVTPDGNWVVYHHSGRDAMWNIWKVPVSGGQSVQLSTKLTTQPAVSRKNGLIACWYSADAAKPRWQIAVFTPDGGEPLHLFEVPDTVSPDTVIRWTPDGKGITYIDNAGGAANLRVQPIDGSPIRKVTNFTSGQIYSFDWAPDGRLAYSRGMSTSDVVMLRDVK